MTHRITVTIEGRDYTVDVGDLKDRPVRATVNGKTYLVHLPAGPAPSTQTGEHTSPPEPARRTISLAGGAVTAPMPGDIAEIRVRPGDLVRTGDVICVLEAMKMMNQIHSARDGVIASVEVQVGQAVDYGAVLVTFE